MSEEEDGIMIMNLMKQLGVSCGPILLKFSRHSSKNMGERKKAADY
jgi:hypothetical protein